MTDNREDGGMGHVFDHPPLSAKQLVETLSRDFVDISGPGRPSCLVLESSLCSSRSGTTTGLILFGWNISKPIHMVQSNPFVDVIPGQEYTLITNRLFTKLPTPIHRPKFTREIGIHVKWEDT